MKFLNQIDGADKLIQDSDNRLVTDIEKAGWDSKANGVHKHTKSDITDFPTSMPANGGNASTVNGKTVAENVPAGAKFTDTIVDISGKADKSQVLTNVPANAKFTDTIVDISGKADITYVDTKVKTNVPVGAVFTDTITTVNNKTGAISKADIVALGIPASDTNTTYSNATTSVSGLMSNADKTKLDGVAVGANKVLNHANNGSISIDGVQQVVYTHPSGTNPHGTTKSDVGLGSVEDTNDASKPVSTAQQSALDLKADKSQVLTNVPSGAKFTDTVYSHPATHPYSMITGTPSSLPANGGNSTTSRSLIGDDTRSVNSPPSEYMSSGSRYFGRAGWQTEFKSISSIGLTTLSGTYAYLQTLNPWSDQSGGYPIQIAYGDGMPCWRKGISNTAWSAWKKIGDVEVSNSKPQNGELWYEVIG